MSLGGGTKLTREEISQFLDTLPPGPGSVELAKAVAASALRFVPRGQPLGTGLFDAVALHTVSCAFEAVALRRGNDGILRVYLARRADDDTAYPGEYHCPGSIRRPDERWADVASRLSSREFRCQVTNPRHVGNIFTAEARGSFISFVFLVDLEGVTNEDKWYPVDKLPRPMVNIHKKMIIPLAVAAFELEEAAARLAELKQRFCHH
jgi:hypothetical protein